MLPRWTAVGVHTGETAPGPAGIMKQDALDAICASLHHPSWEATFRYNYAMAMPGLQKTHYDAIIQGMEEQDPDKSASYLAYGRAIGKAIKSLEAIHAQIESNKKPVTAVPPM
jgi:hypothetical protein